MPVKDVYGKKVSKQNHMVFAHNPTSLLIKELKYKKMSDRSNLYRDIFSGKNQEHWDKQQKELKQQKEIKDFRHMPNQKWHKIISFIKSGVRILGYVLIPFNLVVATIVLIFSEVIGVIEELV